MPNDDLTNDRPDWSMWEQATEDLGIARLTVSELLGGNVRRIREQRGWSQQQLGDRMAQWLSTPWTRQQVYTAERGMRAFAAADVVVLAFALGVAPGALFNPPREGVAVVVLGDSKDPKPVSVDWLLESSYTPAAHATREVDAAVRTIREAAERAGTELNSGLDQLFAALSLMNEDGSEDAS